MIAAKIWIALVRVKRIKLSRLSKQNVRETSALRCNLQQPVELLVHCCHLYPSPGFLGRQMSLAFGHLGICWKQLSSQNRTKPEQNKIKETDFSLFIDIQFRSNLIRSVPCNRARNQHVGIVT